MAATIKEGSDYLLYLKSTSKASPSKRSTRITKVLPSKTKPLATKKTTKIPKKTKKSNTPPKIDHLSLFSLPPVPTILNPIISQSAALMNLPAKSNSRIGLPGGPIAGMIDLVFCCDTTSSMSPYIVKTKSTIQQLIEKIKDKVKFETIDLKFGFVCYRDHPPQDSSYVIQSKNLCDEKEILEFINQQNACGGGDLPEAVMDGLWEAAMNMKWRNPLGTPTLRYVIHIGDAPPHGSLYGPHSYIWKDGCPCGVTIEKIAHVFNMKEIHYRLVKVGSQVDTMAQVFKQHINDYMDLPLEEASTLDIKVSDMIIRELLPDDPSLLMV